MLVELTATSSDEWAATFSMERGQVHGYETSSVKIHHQDMFYMSYILYIIYTYINIFPQFAT